MERDCQSLLWLDGSGDLKSSDSLDGVCVDYGDEEVLMNRRGHETRISQSESCNVALLAWFHNIIFFWEHNSEFCHLDIVLLRILDRAGRVLNNEFEISIVSIMACK